MKEHGTRQVSEPARSASADVGAPHPFDEWLKDELGQLYFAEDAQPLPPEIAELAQRLDRFLNGATGDETSAQPDGSAQDRRERD